MINSDTRIDEALLLRYFEGEVTLSEKDEIEKWIISSEANKKLAKQIYYLSFATKTMDTLKRTDARAALKEVRGRIRRERQLQWGRWAQRAAAILAIPLLLSTLYLWMNGNEQNKVNFIEIRTNPGMITSTILPDGTHVILNSNSTIVYPSHFDEKSRNVQLNGEAYFEVTKDAQHLFIVKTEYFTTTVHGTSFNVCAYSAKEAHVTLVSGSVAVKTNDGPEEFITPGQMASLTEESAMSIKNVDIYPLIQWKEGFFYFERDRLVDIMMELGRWYNVNIVFEHEADMNRQLHFVAEHSDSLKDIVRRLNDLGIAKFKLNKDIISIE